MALRVNDFFNFLDTIAPLKIAEERDVNGLQIGSLLDPVKGVLLAVDPSLSALQEADKRGFNLVITHHPLFYHPLTQIDRDTLQGKIISFAIERKINLLSWHTPLDKLTFGVSTTLAQKLGWETENFVIQEKEGVGWGRIVKFQNYVKLGNLAEEIKEKLKTWVMLVGDAQEEINSLALCGGSGGFLKEHLKKLGLNTLLTSDVKYHLAKDSLQEGFNFIIIDHGLGESFVLEVLKEKIDAHIREIGFFIPVEIYLERSPYQLI
ncbi:MAG: Nif3-like dinuclear metal center hexameric protein [Caldimicrobium sp.]|nr:Nif3-like dinuclear metal center hexameric protein [Caldimicrobium sp.]MCX7873428.1 Nif3-like dinuclear metal center hexameric protein [Caldimicrobium sp.]MDW8094406.1 Nif3-like dinuclear metal center hexameric protein [Caldimicrobium sp.]